MKNIVFVVATLMLAIPAAANAAAPGYNYLDLSYSRTSLNHDVSAGINGMSGGNGYQLAGSYDITSSIFLGASYGHNNFNGGFTTAGLPPAGSPAGGFFVKYYMLTVGGHLPITGSVDFVGRVSYADDSWQQGPSNGIFPGLSVSSSETKTGYDVGVGLRAMMNDRLELNAFVDRDDVGLLGQNQNSVETIGSVGALYNFSRRYGLGVSYAHSNQGGGNNWMLTGRWYF
ncbi:MAG: outer membrane beta-barrel protein [Gammaproteobacteria bacterium]